MSVPKRVFTLKLGWLEANAGTNIGPQNNMYLSAPAQCWRCHFLPRSQKELAHRAIVLDFIII